MSQQELPAIPPAGPIGPRVHNGAYTVSHEKHGHFTVKLYTAPANSDLAGRRILALLCGPSNETDWQGVAFWNEEQDVQWAAVWSRHASDRNAREYPIDGWHWGERWNTIEKKLAIWADLAVRGWTEERHGHWYGNGYRLLREGRCVVCNRLLTHPESIELGIGPECLRKHR